MQKHNLVICDYPCTKFLEYCKSIGLSQESSSPSYERQISKINQSSPFEERGAPELKILKKFSGIKKIKRCCRRGKRQERHKRCKNINNLKRKLVSW